MTGESGDKGMLITVEEDLCTACGLCAERAPDNFALDDDDDVARVIKQPTNEAELEDCTEAVDYCPAGSLVEATGSAGEDAA